MNQDLCGLRVSMDSMGFAQRPPGLSRDEIATIEAAHFDVSVVADAYQITLTEHEQAMTVPREFTQRVSNSRYTWVMYKADSIPDPRVGVQGDVWVETTPGSLRHIFILGERNSWDEWNDTADARYLRTQMGSHRQPAPDLKSVAAYHPWLRQRRLEFDGSTLQWGIVDQNGSLYMERLEKEVNAAGWPKYGEILLSRVAEHLCTAAPLTHSRIVIASSKSTPQNDPPVAWWNKPASPSFAWWSQPNSPPDAGPSHPRSPPVSWASQPSSPFVLSSDAFSLAKKAFPPPGQPPLSPGFQFPPPYMPAPVQAVVKTEEEEESFVLEQLQPRARESISPCPRVKAESDNSEALLAGTTTGMSVPASPSAFFGPAGRAPVSRTTLNPPTVFTTVIATSADMLQFLGSLPVPLTHRQGMLNDLGISSLEYLKSFADAPPAVLGKLTLKLQEQGFTFMEALMIRNGLSPLRHQGPAAVLPAVLESIPMFLAALKPSVARHAPVLKDLGIDTVHLPILARLEAAPYGEFEQALLAKGVPWADCFLIEVALRTRVRL